MWKVSQIICMGALAGMSVVDIRFRKVPAEILVLGGIGVIVYQFLFQTHDIYLIIGGALVGILFLFISKVTKEAVGYGDSLAILILGLYMGLWKLLELLTVTFSLFIPAGIICLLTGRLRKKASFPFYPFLTGGYLLTLAAGVI